MSIRLATKVVIMIHNASSQTPAKLFWIPKNPIIKPRRALYLWTCALVEPVLLNRVLETSRNAYKTTEWRTFGRPLLTLGTQLRNMHTCRQML